MTENTWPFQIAPSNSPPAARTKRKFPPCRADPPRAAWRRTMIPDKSDRGKGTNHTGTQHLCAHTGINVQFGVVFLGRRLSQQRGASKRRTLILQGAAAQRRLCSQWQQDKTAGAVLTLGCRGQRSRERRSRLSSIAKNSNHAVEVQANWISVSSNPLNHNQYVVRSFTRGAKREAAFKPSESIEFFFHRTSSGVWTSSY